MSHLTQNPYYRQYSPFFTGVVFTIIVYIGLAILLYQVSNPAAWIWLTPLALLISAIVLQLSTNRVLHIRIFQFFLMITTITIFGNSLWLLMSINFILTYKIITASFTGILIMAMIVANYRISSKSDYLHDLPHGPVGVLDWKTGLVNPYKSNPLLKDHQDKFQRKNIIIWRLAPLTAGMAMMVVRGLSDSMLNLLIILLCLIVVAGISAGAGATLHYVIATRRWEIQYRKLIFVKR